MTDRQRRPAVVETVTAECEKAESEMARENAAESERPAPEQVLSEGAELEAAETEAAVPDVLESDAAESEVAADADAVESDAVESDAVESDAVESDAVESDAVESDAVESDAVESDAVESEAVESEPVESEAVKAVESEPAETDVVESEPAETDAVETEPGVPEPAMSQAAETDAAASGAVEGRAAGTGVGEGGQVALRERRRRLVPAVLVALVVVSSVGVGVLGWRVYSDARDRKAQDEALAAARAETAQVLSYNARTLEADLANSRKVISGNFAARFEELANTVIVPAAQQRNLATQATVTRAAVIDAPPGQVRALLFVNQVTTMDGQAAPRQVGNQVRVTMTWADGRWLISDLQPL